MIVAGIDPGRAVGFAVVELRTTAPPRVLVLRSVRGETDRKAILMRMIPHLDQAAALGARLLVVEQPPPAARDDVHHGYQAAIGDAQGYLGGLLSGWWLARTPGADAARALPSVWRPLLLQAAARCGVLLAPPNRRSVANRATATRERPVRAPGGGWTLRWSGCNHAASCASLDELQRVPATCPTCTGTAPTATADAVRDAWKATACRAVAALAPELYAALVDDARSRARAPHDDHRLAGVADACEAVGVALAGVASRWC